MTFINVGLSTYRNVVSTLRFITVPKLLAKAGEKDRLTQIMLLISWACVCSLPYVPLFLSFSETT